MLLEATNIDVRMDTWRKFSVNYNKEEFVRFQVIIKWECGINKLGSPFLLWDSQCSDYSLTFLFAGYLDMYSLNNSSALTRVYWSSL